MKKILAILVIYILTMNFNFSQTTLEEESNISFHSLEELKSFEGIYGSDDFPLKFKLYENQGKLVMSWVGRSEDESMILDEEEKNKFSMPLAGLELDFQKDEKRFETKTVSSKGISIEVDTIILKKMFFKIGGKEILFTMLADNESSDENTEK